MKKINYLAMIAFLMAMFCTVCTSCKDDDDDDNASSSLIGTWKSVSTTYIDDEGKEVTDNDTDEEYDLLIITEDKVTNEFYFDGKKSGDMTFPYEAKGNKLYMMGEEAEFSISGNTLTIKTDDEEDGPLTQVYKRQ